MTKRKLFAERSEGFDALAAERQGKITLRKHKVDMAPASQADRLSSAPLHTACARRASPPVPK